MDAAHLPHVLLDGLNAGTARHPLHADHYGFRLHCEILLKSSHRCRPKTTRQLFFNHFTKAEIKPGVEQAMYLAACDSRRRQSLNKAEQEELQVFIPMNFETSPVCEMKPQEKASERDPSSLNATTREAGGEATRVVHAFPHLHLIYVPILAKTSDIEISPKKRIKLFLPLIRKSLISAPLRIIIIAYKNKPRNKK